MTDITTYPHYDEALTWANEIRAVRGLGPIDRLPDDAPSTISRVDACPLAQATGLSVGRHTAWRYDLGEDHSFTIPDPVQEFVMYVDLAEVDDLDEAVA